MMFAIAVGVAVTTRPATMSYAAINCDWYRNDFINDCMHEKSIRMANIRHFDIKQFNNRNAIL